MLMHHLYCYYSSNQALPLRAQFKYVKLFAFKFVRGGGEPGSRLLLLHALSVPITVCMRYECNFVTHVSNIGL